MLSLSNPPPEMKFVRNMMDSVLRMMEFVQRMTDFVLNLMGLGHPRSHCVVTPNHPRHRNDKQECIRCKMHHFEYKSLF